MKHAAERFLGGIGRVALLLHLSLAPLAASDSFQPLRVPPETITERIDTIVIEPILVPATLEDSEGTRAHWEELVQVALAAKGYAVVAANEFDRVWLSHAEVMGQLFDPIDGAPDEAKVATVRDHTMRELERLHGVDAALRIRLYARPIFPGERRGAYFAVDEPLLWLDGEIMRSRPSRVVGPFVEIALHDAGGTLLFGGSVAVAWMRVYAHRNYFERSEGVVVRDRQRSQAALDAILEHLPERSNGEVRP